MAEKKTTRTRIMPKSLKMKFSKIDLDKLNVQRDPEHYDGGIGKMRFNDCNGRPKLKSHRRYIAPLVELKTNRGVLFGRVYHDSSLGRKVYSSGWLVVALNRAHEYELQKRKKVFLSFLEDESALRDKFYERLIKYRKEHENIESN